MLEKWPKITLSRNSNNCKWQWIEKLKKWRKMFMIVERHSSSKVTIKSGKVKTKSWKLKMSLSSTLRNMGIDRHGVRRLWMIWWRNIKSGAKFSLSLKHSTILDCMPSKQGLKKRKQFVFMSSKWCNQILISWCIHLSRERHIRLKISFCPILLDPLKIHCLKVLTWTKRTTTSEDWIR